jgi:hypothetical protein
MVDFASTQAQVKEVAPPDSHEEGGRMRPPWTSPRALHLRSLPMGWTRCTTNWRRFTPSPSFN